MAALDDGGVEGVVQQGLEPAAGVAQLVERGVGLRGVEQAQQLRAFVGGQGFGEGLDHQVHAGGDVHWQAAPVEDLQGAAELGHGAAAQGHGAVSAGAAEDDLGAAAGLFGDLDGVVLVAVEEGRVAADLTDGVAHAAEEFGVFVDEVTGAVATADLLVRQDEQQHVAGGRETLRVGAQAGGDHHGDAALHVQCAAAPDATVGDGAAEGGCVQCWPTVVTTSTWP